MKKICYFINSDWYFELHWLDRACASLEAGYAVYIISHFSNGITKKRLENFGFICHESDLNERTLNPFSFIFSGYKLIKLFNLIGPDLIHSVTIKPIILGGLYSKLKKISFVASFVGLGRVFQSETLIYKILKLVTKNIYKYIFSNINSRLIFEHPADLQIISTLVNIDGSRMTVIDGAGIDINKFSFTEENSQAKPVVLFASRLLWSKGLSTLVKIKEKVVDTTYDFTLNVAGIEIPDDADAIPISTIENWNKKGVINWLGNRSDVDLLIKNSNVVALPSTYFEGVPRILIEASASGRVCIAYDSGGCASLIKNGETGIVVERGNIMEFSGQLIELLNSPEKRKEMATLARKVIECRFSATIVSEKTLSIYKLLLK